MPNNRIDAKRAPRCGELAAGVDPPTFPFFLGGWPLAGCAASRSSLSGTSVPDDGRALLRALLRNARKKRTDLSLPVTAVPAESPDGRELSCLCPACDGLRVNSEHCGNFSGREQGLRLWRAC